MRWGTLVPFHRAGTRQTTAVPPPSIEPGFQTDGQISAAAAGSIRETSEEGCSELPRRCVRQARTMGSIRSRVTSTGFLDNDVFSCTRSRDRGFHVRSRGCADGSGVDARITREILDTFVHAAAEARGAGFGGRSHVIAEGDDLGSLDLADGLRLHFADHAAADNSDPYGFLPCTHATSSNRRTQNQAPQADHSASTGRLSPIYTRT